MKLAYEKINTVLEFADTGFIGVIIENPGLMYEFVTEIKEAIEGKNTGIVVSMEDVPVNISNEAVLITDFVGFSLKSKTFNTKIVNELSLISENEIFYQETHKLMAQIEHLIHMFSLDMPYDVMADKLNMQSILKGIGLSVADENESLEETILAYMDLERELNGKKLFIFINLRSFTDHDRLSALIETAATRDHNVLLIDNKEYTQLKGEKRLIIDYDLCEI